MYSFRNPSIEQTSGKRLASRIMWLHIITSPNDVPLHFNNCQMKTSVPVHSDIPLKPKHTVLEIQILPLLWPTKYRSPALNSGICLASLLWPLTPPCLQTVAELLTHTALPRVRPVRHGGGTQTPPSPVECVGEVVTTLPWRVYTGGWFMRQRACHVPPERP